MVEEKLDLPAPVLGFVRAINMYDLDGMASRFAPDAIANNQMRHYTGREAIRAWLAKEIAFSQSRLCEVAAASRSFGWMGGASDAIVFIQFVRATGRRLDREIRSPDSVQPEAADTCIPFAW